MSLKVIHVVFIACACAGLAFFSIWCFTWFANRDPVLAVAGGSGAALALLALLLVERRVLATVAAVKDAG
jgi:hypothetical protein